MDLAEVLGIDVGVDLGGGDIGMAEIGAESGHVVCDRSAVVRASLQRADRKGMAQVVQTCARRAGRSAQAELPRKTHEDDICSGRARCPLGSADDEQIG